MVMKNQSYYIETLGCQMNVRDSETIAAILDGLGLFRCNSADAADVLVINTCSVRRKPEEKVFSRLGEWNLLKQEQPEIVIAVCGCMAQVATDEIRRRAPYVDIIAGPRALGDLRDVFADALADDHDSAVCVTDNSAIIPEGLPVHREDDISAYVNITYGCDNFCAYCIVPHARGRELSRQPTSIIAECERAIARGHKEITLLGQNVNSYGHDLDIAIDFPDLMYQVATLDGLRRLRFTTSHPKDCSRALLERMAHLDTVCEHLHLPVQSGDDEVLRRMGRNYTSGHFRAIIQQARELMDDLAVTTDVMVGFPGETPQQFENTLELFEKIRFDQAFMFKYNDRPGTRAAEMSDKVPEDEKQRRLVELIELQNTISQEKNQAAVGDVYEVLVEGRDPKSPECVRGRTRQNKIMIFEGPVSLSNQIVRVRAEEGYLWGFRGSRVQENTATG
ncbi:MAG: tRNA (N6-isopentenyl adenosine(37)-C2)-methylthiotransferase MiaB [Armatimonadota bacterium]